MSGELDLNVAKKISLEGTIVHELDPDVHNTSSFLINQWPIKRDVGAYALIGDSFWVANEWLVMFYVDTKGSQDSISLDITSSDSGRFDFLNYRDIEGNVLGTTPSTSITFPANWNFDPGNTQLNNNRIRGLFRLKSGETMPETITYDMVVDGNTLGPATASQLARSGE